MAKGKRQKRDTIRAMQATDDSQRVLDLLAEAESAERLDREHDTADSDDAAQPAERDADDG